MSHRPCYRACMLKTQMKRRDAAAVRAATRLAAIEASIVALNDEDVLDIADIFRDEPGTPLAELASAEMQRRKLTL